LHFLSANIADIIGQHEHVYNEHSRFIRYLDDLREAHKMDAEAIAEIEEVTKILGL
jgi:hypothetical protein